ncbi:conserved Plasmodium protein, unknown function [Plasmodium ovale]|nr:conserved Plasmodium protein, unknown function [Plasmodium ovale]
MIPKEKKKVLRSLARTVGKLSNFFDEHQIWKCFISNIYRYENEKSEKYNDFLTTFLNSNVHYCPLKANKKKLRSELIRYMRRNLNEDDVFNVGFTAVRHLGRIKNAVLTAVPGEGSKSDILSDNKKTVRGTPANGPGSIRSVWCSEEERLLFRNNLRILNLGLWNDREEGVNEEEGEKKKKRPSALKKNINRRCGKMDMVDAVEGGCAKEEVITETSAPLNCNVGKEVEARVEVEADAEEVETTGGTAHGISLGTTPPSCGNEPIYEHNNQTKKNKKNFILKKGNYKNEIKKGVILIAHPLTSSPLWNKSVILITQKDKNNLVCGLILNKHPLYNNTMGLPNDKEIAKILNKLYLKKKRFLNDVADGIITDQRKCIHTKGEKTIQTETGIPDIKMIGTREEEYDKMITKGGEESVNMTNDKGENRETALEKKHEMDIRRESNCVKNRSSNSDNSTTTQGESNEDFPTLKDLQEMFLRIQFRSSSKHYMNKRIKRKNNLFIMMDEHLLDIITHYIIKLNKVPLYLRFLPSYNIGSMTDIKNEMKKLQFLNEFYKIYFEKYNKWKVVIINNRIHIFDKNKSKKKVEKITTKVVVKNEEGIEKKELSEEEIARIHRKIQNFKETNRLIEDDEEGEEGHYDQENGETCQRHRRRGKSGAALRGTVRQQGYNDGQEQSHEEDENNTDAEEEEDENNNDDEEEEDENNDDDEEEEEEEEEEGLDEEEEGLDEEEEGLDEEEEDLDNAGVENAEGNLDKMTSERATVALPSGRKDAMIGIRSDVVVKEKLVRRRKRGKSVKGDPSTKAVTSAKKVGINTVHKNYFVGNPVHLFWLGGPLPGLTILHNIRRISKNIVINDFIYEGYNENVDTTSSCNQDVKDSMGYMVEEGTLTCADIGKVLVGSSENTNPSKNELMCQSSNIVEVGGSTCGNVDSEGCINRMEGKKLIKRFIGKTTWDMNQLMDELKNDYWIAINCENRDLLSNIIFNSGNDFLNDTHGECTTGVSAYKGEHLWEKILSSLSTDYEAISKIPQHVIDTVLKDFRGTDGE